MDKTKQTLVAALMAGLVVVAGGWFFLISPQRSNVSSLNAQTQTVTQQNASLQSQIAQLKSESAAVSGAQATLAAIARRLPPDPQLANLIYDLQNAAEAANVDLQVITPQSPVLAAAPAAAVVTTAPAPSGAPAKPAARGAVPASTSQLYQIPLSLTVAGNYFDVEMFVHSLEKMQRAMVIDQLALARGTNSTSGTLSATTAAGSSTLPGGTSTAAATTSAPAAKAGTSKTSKSTTSKSVKAAKPGKPGTPAGAIAELNGQQQFVPDANTLAVTITGKVFAMYSPDAAAAVAAAAAAAAPAAVTPAPATTK